MIVQSMVVAVCSLVLLVAPGAPMRLEGLDRLYFDRVAGPGEPPGPRADVSRLLPAFLPEPALARATPRGRGTGSDLSVRDFELPARPDGGRLWLREVLDASHPRVSEVWWVLYDRGRRRDVWHHTSHPARSDGKFLGNYRLDGVSLPAPDLAVLRVRVVMFRPGGVWWVAGKELVLGVGGRAIVPRRVRNVFGFFRSGGEDGDLSVRTGSIVDGRIEEREHRSPTDEALAACGLEAPSLLDDGWEFSWSDLERAARCVTERPGTIVTHRGLDAPTFAERPRPAGAPSGR